MIDQFGRTISYLRLSVTELCNLRCRYCMPAEGICKKAHEEMLTEEEMIRAVRAAAFLGISKLRVTGGEPLVKKNILSICSRAAQVPGIRELCITTNGLLLPQMASDLKNAGVRRVNISLDTLREERYAYITRTGHLEQALEGLRCAVETGFDKVKINTVLIGGFNDDEIADLAALTVTYPVDVRFIELMPMYDSGDFGPEAYVPGSTVLEAVPELKELAPQYRTAAGLSAGTCSEAEAALQDRTAAGLSAGTCSEAEAAPQDGVARLYKIPGAKGTVGLINPLSAHFCNTCNRIRITADGKVKPCLHSREEYSIKGLNEEDMTEVLRQTILGKPQWHGELSSVSRSHAGRNMNQIGG